MQTIYPGGRYHLRPGIQLIPETQGGVVLQRDPLRAIRVNATAFRILGYASDGFGPQLDCHRKEGQENQRLLAFLDTMCQAGIMEWRPAQTTCRKAVSIVVAVYNRAHEIAACIESLISLDYPASLREIIVVDDASSDQTAAVVRHFDVRLITLPQNRGQSAARNAGARAATGQIIAFMDSDCTAGAGWLRELMPYFQDPRVVLIGGLVEGRDRRSHLDRYEMTHSPLNMGDKMRIGSTPYADFYVPTCNMLVRKQAYLAAGGLDEDLRIGEDVDLCWKMKELGHRLMYIPAGKVHHRHRNQVWPSFKRRYDYGTSEAMLYNRHGKVAKRFPWQTNGLLVLLACVFGLTTRTFLALPVIGVILLVESFCLRRRLAVRFNAVLSFTTVLRAVAKSHFSLAYFLSYYYIRYFMLAGAVLAFLVPQLWPLLLVAVLFPTMVEYRKKNSRLPFHRFAFFFWLEQLFYQAGAFRGCLREGSFRLYRIAFVATGFMHNRRELVPKRLKRLVKNAPETSA
jgi:mycofactocin system glycosyltransferase